MGHSIPVVYTCCSVAHYGSEDDPCWVCGLDSGRDAWANTWPGDHDGEFTRKYVTAEATNAKTLAKIQEYVRDRSRPERPLQGAVDLGSLR